MAAKKGKKVAQKQYKGTISYRLTDVDRQIIDQRVGTVDYVKLIEKWAMDDWRPAIKVDIDNACYRLDIYRCFTGHPDSGYSYVARHDEVDKLFEIADYVVYTVFDGTLPVGDKQEFSW